MHTIYPADVFFVTRAISAVVITFTTVPACSLLSCALPFAFTFPVLLDRGESLILCDLVLRLLVFSLISCAQSLNHVRC